MSAGCCYGGVECLAVFLPIVAESRLVTVILLIAVWLLCLPVSDVLVFVFVGCGFVVSGGCVLLVGAVVLVDTRVLLWAVAPASCFGFLRCVLGGLRGESSPG